ncbi:unnamed protein product [Staurois parvus]|uniref:Uncharacterized protein n=1 Tax=Staurois parvus TaxID=386267 RepID=A0ABN9EYW9_9NEOB|nr:unnamed protein product [Staurois parvus]
MTSALSCDQLCPITADRMALMISATYRCPSMLPVSTHQCHISLLVSAT